MSTDEEKENSAKAENTQKAMIEIRYISSKCSNLLEHLNEIKEAKDLTDQEVSQHLLDSSRWENKLDDIIAAKVKVEQDIIGLEMDEQKVTEFINLVDKLSSSFNTKLADLKKADNERCLFLLSKPVKELAVYPYAILVNQVRTYIISKKRCWKPSPLIRLGRRIKWKSSESTSREKLKK